MNKFAFILPIVALAACSQEPAAEPAGTAVATPVASATPTLPAPDQALFSDVFAKTCPEAAEVNTAVCKRAAFGSDEVSCEYGLGEDTYLRNQATLTPADGAWALKDAATVCTADLNKPAA